MRRLLKYSGAVAAVGVVLVFLGVPVEASAAPARTLVSVRGPISVFAQDGMQIAWVNRRSYDSYVVRIRSLTTGTSALFVSPYDVDLGSPPRRLAVGGTRVIWFAERCLTMEEACWDEVWTGALGERTKARLAQFWHDMDADGTYVGPMAGGSGTLAYSTQEWGESPLVFLGGEVWRVTGRAQSVVSSAPGAVVLAASSGRIAMVPGTPGTYDPTVSIELRDPVSGALLGRITAGGNVRALAFSGAKIAALIESPTGARSIERYDVGTGALIGSSWVSPGVAAELDMAGNRIVYRTGRAIRLMDAITGAKQLLLQPSFRPIGLSIEGRRVAWAVNRNDGGRIMAVTLP